MVQGHRQIEVVRRLVGALFLSVTVHWLLLEYLPLWHGRYIDARGGVGSDGLSATLLPRSSDGDRQQRIAGNPVSEQIASPSTGTAGKGGNGSQRQVGGGAEKSYMPSVAGVHYFGVSDLDVAPQAVHVPALDSKKMIDFPSASGVELLVYVESDGRVSRVDVLSGEDPFSSAAREGFLGALFWPARKNGEPVRSRVVVVVDYPSVAGDRLLK